MFTEADNNKRNTFWTYLICSIFIIIQYLICINVYMMGGDDYMFGTFGHDGVIASVFSYYFTGNGRWLVNIINSFLLYFDRYLYLILAPWLTLFLAYLLFRFIIQLTNTIDIRLFAVSVCFISIIDIQMTRETTYWISGSMNYLLPSLFLVSGMTSVLKFRQSNLSSKDTIINTIICLLSCSLVEQFGLMSIGWMLLIWGFDYVKNKKLIKRNVLVFALSLICISIIILAPGNYVRIDKAVEKGTSLSTKIINLIYYCYYSKVSSTFLFIIASICSYKFYKSRRLVMSVLSFINAFILLFCFDYHLIDVPFVIVIISMILSLITIIPCLVYVFKQYGLITLYPLFVIVLGSQLMLLISDLWGFRTSMSMVIFYIIVNLVLMRDVFNDGISSFAISMICIAINQYLGIIVIVTYCVFYLYKYSHSMLTMPILLVCVLVGLSDEVIGYHLNKNIHKDNINAVKQATKNNNLTEVRIHSYDGLYGWVSPPFSEWAENCFRSYYNIPYDIPIVYVDGKD